MNRKRIWKIEPGLVWETEAERDKDGLWNNAMRRAEVPLPPTSSLSPPPSPSPTPPLHGGRTCFLPTQGGCHTRQSAPEGECSTVRGLLTNVDEQCAQRCTFSGQTVIAPRRAIVTKKESAAAFTTIYGVGTIQCTLGKPMRTVKGQRHRLLIGR